MGDVRGYQPTGEPGCQSRKRPDGQRDGDGGDESDADPCAIAEFDDTLDRGLPLQKRERTTQFGRAFGVGSGTTAR
ncbi:hypothetical protein C461_14026 [Halorubrum aidingense JCM 13560]|uniref:Uncharacterized protein n=1 Tax=Halorubrum aidingense JCM 13560 TaxID=1230454 RepID=M0P8E1_9EURY|nr:hypothetical protein C461_14026 [Halorubrum aidingense JCM 13560]